MTPPAPKASARSWLACLLALLLPVLACVALPQQAAAQAAVVDLRPQNVRVSTTTPTVGVPFSVEVQVQNVGTGGGLAGPTTITYLASTNSSITTGDTSLATATVPALYAFTGRPPGTEWRSTETASVTIDTAGTYWIGACVSRATADAANGYLAESLANADNNCAGRGASMSDAITVSEPVPVAPAITTQPANQSVTVGADATFTVAVTGTPTPTYQWRKDGTEISGATSASYTVSGAAEADAGDYTVVVTNTAGTVTSTAATLTVTPAPVVDLRPQNVRVSTTTPTVGVPFSVEVQVQNVGTGGGLAGPTTLTYLASTNSSITTDDTSLATATVPALYAFTGRPPGTEWRSTETASVTIDTAGTYWIGACVSRATADTANGYLAEPLANADNNCAGRGASMSDAITVSEPVPVAPAITTQPANQSVTVGADATFTVAATGTPTPTYQWRKDGTEISEATSASYTVSGAAEADAGDYTVVVSNTAGTVTSTAATLTVTPAPVVDLAVRNVMVSDTTPTVGVPFSIQMDVRNIGTGGGLAGPTTLTYLASTDASITLDDTSLATATVPALYAFTGRPPGTQWSSSETASVTIDTAGTYWIGACVSRPTEDTANGYLAELLTDGDNNCGVVGSTINDSITVSEPVPVAPAITTQPTNQSVTVGANATFTVAATGTPTPTYQWRKDGSDISGATSASYTVSGAAEADAGDYTVVVTNTAGTVTSTAATLTVTPAPVVDLAVRNVMVSDTTPTVGVPFSIQMDVRNIGTGGGLAGPTTLTYLASTDASITLDDTSLATATVPALYAFTGRPPGTQWSSSETASVTIDTAGTYWIGACVSRPTEDTANGYLAELLADGDNNCGVIGSTINDSITVSEPVPVAPAITTQPTNQSVTVGANATFTVAATGTPTPTYQWRKDGSDISGATSASYTVSGAAEADAGDYTVVVTNTAGTVTSTAATLTVTPAPVVDLAVRNVMVSDTTPTVGVPFSIQMDVRNIGTGGGLAGPTTLTYLASTDASITLDDTSLATATVPALYAFTGRPPGTQWSSSETASVTIDTAGTYWIGACVSRPTEDTANGYLAELLADGDNNCGVIGSTINDSITVSEPVPVAPAITTQPTNQSVTVGADATFTVAATGTPTPTYQWRFDGSDISGATSETYTLSNAALTNAGEYTVVVTNTVGTVTSSAATLTVTPAAVAPQITTQPTDRSVTVGENATFTVAATGTPTPTYQWRFEGSDISGATSASYTLSSAALTNAGDYTVVVTNTAGTVTSSAATLTVTPAAVAPQITTQPTDQSVTVGENATFTVTATGTPTPTYQWRFEGSDISGATSASYTLSSAALTNAGDYTVVVTNTAGTVTSSAATLTVTAAAVAPQITTQPTGQSVTVGENATFTVAATGTPTPTYQWRFEGSDISGATSETYTLSNAALTNAGDYTVVVTNTAGTVTSTAATLTVTAAAVAPQITTQPTDQSVTVGENATFTVTATGTPTPTYQWRFEGSDISGATSASYTLSSAALTNAGDYTVVVTNTAGTVTSSAATLTVTAAAVAPQITTQPTDQSVTVGENATFTVAATGTPTPTYQWRFEGSDISGATSETYALSNAALTNAGDYTVVVTNTAGTVTSSAATLTVTAAAVAPQITTQPTDQSVTVGENATFTVAATGTPTPTYQWRFEGSDISGATSASYTLSSAALTNAGDYTVVVTNTAGTVTSSAATLTVTAAAPDLTVGSVSVSSASVAEGASFTINATVNNGGNGASAATTLTYYRSADATITTGDASIATDSVGALAASGSSPENASVSIAAAGIWYVGACVPTVSGETNANNNCSTGVQVTVTAATPPPAVTIGIANASATEGDDIRFAVTLSTRLLEARTLNIGYTAGTATLATDLGTRPTTLTLPTGTTTVNLDVPTVDDDTNENDETFTVTLSLPDPPANPRNTLNIATGTATGTITDNDEAAPPALEPSDLAGPRLIAAGTTLRRHAERFDRLTGTVAQSRLDGRETRRLSGSKDLGDGALATGGELGETRWGAWIDGAWAGFRGKASGRQADVYGGVDYLGGAGHNWLIGALIGYETADLDTDGAAYRSDYAHLGVYGGARVSERLLFDGAATYGTATPDVTLEGVSASYDAHRFTVRGALTGDFGLEYALWTGSVKVQPQLGMLYSRERLGAFTDSAGGTAGRELLELGRFSAGPRLTWAFDGGEVVGGARVQWDVLQIDEGSGNWISGAADIGVRFDLTPNVTLSIQGDVDGIGVSDEFRSLGGRVELDVRI